MQKNKFAKTMIAGYITFSLLILFWEFAVFLLDVSPIVLVRPSEIYPTMIENSDILIREMQFTVVEIMGGWLFGNLFAIAAAILIYRFRQISNIFISLSVTLNAVPLIALAAILGGIIGTGQFGKSVIVGVLCFFPMFLTALKSFIEVDKDHKFLFKTYAAGEFTQFVKLIFPGSLPNIFSTLKINVATSIFGAVVGEFFGAHGGIGNLILAEKGLYDLPMVWSAIFYIIIFGTIFYTAVVAANRLLIPWRT